MKTKLDETNKMRRLMGLTLLNEQDKTRDIGERTDLIVAITRKLKEVEGDANLYKKPYSNPNEVKQEDIAYEAYIGGPVVKDWGGFDYLANNTEPSNMDYLLSPHNEVDLKHAQWLCDSKILDAGYSLLIGKTTSKSGSEVNDNVYYIQPPNNGEAHLSVGSDYRNGETVYQNDLLKVFTDLILPGYRTIYRLICQKPSKTWAKSDGRPEDMTGTEMA